MREEAQGHGVSRARAVVLVGGSVNPGAAFLGSRVIAAQ